MLTEHQRRWGIDSWVTFLKDKVIPVLPTTRVNLAALREAEQEHLSPRHLANIVYEDPFLALKLLRRVEGHRSHRLGQDTTTALASVLQAGVDELSRTVNNGPVADMTHTGMVLCVSRTVMASRIAGSWAQLRTDVAADEVALAALLAESGELLLWHFADELPLRALEELTSGRAVRTAQAQQQAAGFSFKQMTTALVDAWALPALITQLIHGSDTLRANIPRLAADTARHLISNVENPAIPADIANIKKLIPGANERALIAPLHLSDEYRDVVLQALAEGNFTPDLK